MAAAVTLTGLAAELVAVLRARSLAGTLSLSALARSIHISQPHLSALIHARRAPTLQTAEALRIGLGLTLDDVAALLRARHHSPPWSRPPRPAPTGYGRRVGRAPRMTVARSPAPGAPPAAAGERANSTPKLGSEIRPNPAA